MLRGSYKGTPRHGYTSSLGITLVRGPILHPDTVLSGVCATCRTAVEMRSAQATPPAGDTPGSPVMFAWSDCWTAECPGCGARVLLAEK